MADIISIDGKRSLSEKKKEALVRKRKVQAVQKIFQCTQCAFKCEKCGTQLGETSDRGSTTIHKQRIPYRLCESCAEEYVDYIERHKGRGDVECYWHNDDWIDLWRCWIDYQATIDRYMKSKEFLRLLQELKQNRPEDE